jgi:hypothetical protein
MDPTKCYEEMEEHIKDAVEKARLLMQWLNRGGFWPAVPGATKDDIVRRLKEVDECSK